jgi:endonuclease/exonuclease/phosphatase family metal-dependent hydrolase
VDFNNTTAEIQADVTAVAPRADVIMFQEAKWVTIDDFLDASWTVYQVVDQGDARRGSAIAIRNSIATSILATGLRFGVDSDGVQMLDRYIAWADVQLINGRRLRVMSLHMPPQRYEYLQPRMANNLATFVKLTPYATVVGGDWNFTVENDPWNITESTGLVPRGVGIDGFFFSPEPVSVVSVNRLSGLNVNSDHHPVQMITNVADESSAIADWNLYH